MTDAGDVTSSWFGGLKPLYDKLGTISTSRLLYWTNNRLGQTPLSLTFAECCQMIADWELDAAKWSTLFISTAGNCTRETSTRFCQGSVTTHAIMFEIRQIEVWKKTPGNQNAVPRDQLPWKHRTRSKAAAERNTRVRAMKAQVLQEKWR